jgi:hypothetical protein
MKYTWEREDIRPGRQVEHFSGKVYTVVSVDSKDKTNTGYALLADNRVTPTYTVDELTELFNTQSCIPLSL